MVDLADVIYVHSEYYWHGNENSARRDGSSASPDTGGEDAPARSERKVLFGEHAEGRIALANRKKDPLYFFASLNRQLGYPEVPRAKVSDKEQALLPQLARRLEQLETRLKFVEEEQRGGLDLTQFYERPPGGRPPFEE